MYLLIYIKSNGYIIQNCSYLPGKVCHCPSPELKIIGTCDGARQNWPNSLGVVFSHGDFITPTAIIVMNS